MNVYKCPICHKSAIESLWDDITEDYYKKRGGAGFVSIKTISRTKLDGNEDTTLFVCPYCEAESVLGEMKISPKKEVKRVHLEEDLFIL